MDRNQAQCLPPTLEELVPAGHPVRFYDEILRKLDWREWEAQYNGRRGQPPIHPRLLCAAILYGLTRGIRSSRQLEDACRNRWDFHWLMEGRTPDHSTFAEFRTRFGKEIREVGKQVNHVALDLGFIALQEVATDGTLVKANNSRHATATRETLEKRLAQLDEQLEKALREMGERDRQERTLFGLQEMATELPEKIRKLEERKKALDKAFEELKAVEEAKRKSSSGGPKKAAQVPLTDPESRVLQNKEGGYAPNYTPLMTVETKSGFIVSADVINDSAEGAKHPEAIDRIKEDYGEQPKTAMADGSYAISTNVVAMESQGVELLTPLKSSEPQEGNPAKREDASQPVPAEKHAELPRCPQTKKLDKTAFVYVETGDFYHCPNGRKLLYRERKKHHRVGGDVSYNVYQCESCDGCPLAGDCLSNPPKPRTVSRDIHEASREKVAQRMQTEEAKTRYKRRSWAAETPSGFIKRVMGIRQFLLRGLQKVKEEWQWICCAYNLNKLAGLKAALRAEEAGT